MQELLKTALFGGAALALAISAAMIEPERAVPTILSDQGAAFYPKFTNPQAARSIEIVDYDEATATARPFKVEFQRGRWVIPTHNNYRVELGDRLAKTAAALVDLKKDLVQSDSTSDHAKFGVVDPLDQKVAGLAGRGKRVTLRDQYGDVLADYVFGKPVPGKPGYRYVRVPGQKRTYAVKTDADPSARFADWVNANVLRISGTSIRKVVIHRYSIDETAGRIANVETSTFVQEGGAWKSPSGDKLNLAAVKSMAHALDSLRIVDVRPKPPSLAQDLRKGQVQLSLETAMSLRQKGFFLTPSGRIMANEGEMVVETNNGLVYTLRFGEIAPVTGEVKASNTEGENRHLFVTVHFDPARARAYGGDAQAGERLARELTDRFADWFYIISGADFQKLRMKKRGDVAAAAPKPGA